MATLTKSTGTVTLSGAAEKVTLPASYGWVWVKNMSDSDIFAGLSADISEGADGVLTIPAGECGRVQMDGSREFYLLGTGNALVVAQNYADCPFKGVKKGGDSGGLQLDENALFTGDVIFPEGVTTIPNSYFFRNGIEYTGDVKSITFPTTLTSLGESAIRYIPTLQAVTFKGNNLKTIGRYCFMADPNLKEVILPEGVETIEYAAFGYINIEKLYLPASCISIDSGAFDSDSNLTAVSVGVGFNCDLKISSGTFTAEILNAIIANYAENSGKTLTVGSTNLAKLSDDDIAAASAKGLTLA